MDTSRFIICRAAAGSGKTYTLVRQYLELAFSAREEDLPQRFRRILAITFTKKAANEMKERILAQLDEMARTGTGCDMGRDLAQSLNLGTGPAASSTLQRYATIVRKAILHNYSDFAVCTIDSFMHGIICTFAHDLGLPPKFDVHIENDDLIQNAVDNLLALIGTEGQQELSDMLCEYVSFLMEDDRSFRIERQLSSLASQLFTENAPSYFRQFSSLSPKDFQQRHRQLAKDCRLYEQHLAALGQQGLDAIRDKGLELTDFYYGSTGAGIYFSNLAQGMQPSPNSRTLQYLEGDKLGSGKASRDTLAALEAVKPTLQALHNQIKSFREQEEPTYNSRKILLSEIYPLAVLNKMKELVDNYSSENEVVHISEFNRRIGEVVQNEPVPFIYERIGSRYWNYLIDEFQDTSTLQWQNLVPLLDNGVSSGHTSLVVGDGKQAIYRFRQGNVEQFVALPHVDNELHGAALAHPDTARIDRLATNYRSRSAIVQFNNHFFEWAALNRFADNKYIHDIFIGTDPANPDLAQQVRKDGGYVKACFTEPDKDDTAMWELMRQDIDHLHHDLGHRYSDITILARNNKTLTQIAQYLTACDIPIVSNESFLLTNSRVVMLLRNAMQLELDENDAVARQHVQLYLRQLGIDGLQASDITLHGSESLYDSCESILRQLHLENTETAYVATLLNTIAHYSSRHRQDIAEFLEWFDAKSDKRSCATPDSLDAIRLMTIHKAKGLESPIVLYPILNQGGSGERIWVNIPQDRGIDLPTSIVTLKKDDVPTLFNDQFDKERKMKQLDDINILYVALTRPKEQLFIYCKKNSKDGTGYANLLYDYCHEHLGPDTDADTETYSTGQPAPRGADPKESSTATRIDLGTLVFPDWQSRIGIARQAAACFAATGEDCTGTDATSHGTQIHEILSLMPHRGDTGKAIETYRHLHPGSDTDALQEEVEQLMRQDEVSRFFDPAHPCKNEVSLVWNGAVLRPDRIVLMPDATYVIDFKTGRPHPEHHLQVQRYCDALAAMGYTNLRGRLLYLSPTHSQIINVC